MKLANLILGLELGLMILYWLYNNLIIHIKELFLYSIYIFTC